MEPQLLRTRAFDGAAFPATDPARNPTSEPIVIPLIEIVFKGPIVVIFG